MTLAAFKDEIATLGIPFAYGSIKAGQSTPYIAYSATSRNAVYADGVAVYAEEWITLQLVTKVRDIALETQVLELLGTCGLAAGEPDYDFDEKEHVHIASFYFQIGG